MKNYPIKSDSRYSIELEYCGHAKPYQVLRFCGDFVASSPFLSAMIIRAAGHNAMRNGSPAIVETPVK